MSAKATTKAIADGLAATAAGTIVGFAIGGPIGAALLGKFAGYSGLVLSAASMADREPSSAEVVQSIASVVTGAGGVLRN